MNNDVVLFAKSWQKTYKYQGHQLYLKLSTMADYGLAAVDNGRLLPGCCTAHNIALLMKSRSEPCLKFTKEHLRKPDEIHTGIIFITLIRPRQRYLASFHIIKFGRKRTTNGRRNVILWDCFSSHTTGQLHRFKGRRYRNTYILNKTLLTSLKALKNKV